MIHSFLKIKSRQFNQWVVSEIMSELDENDLERSAVVFSPHPDDETLGCGGTIIKKKKAGADVNIVFMTDGRRSHRQLISENELKAIRASEALAASRMLGVEENNVVLLEFKDGQLSEGQDSAIQQVTELLLHQQPDEIFIPYNKEAVPDHLATNCIVLSAVELCGRKAIVYEYPIWFWQHWPWASVPMRRREILTVLKTGFVSTLSLLRDFRCRVYIGDVLELKRAALDQYRSQMTRLVADPRWRTLGDVSNGEFLEPFFQDHEIFRRYSLLGKR